jgi:antirestriction protein ArdC
MKSSSNTSDRFNIYEAITNQIITAIESGTGDVQMPWHQSGASLQRPINVQSRRPYRGVNTVALWAIAEHII